jgi:apolipoprotein N-acyltransferase
MNKYILILLSLAGGFLLGLAWTDWCTGLILLTGFVPFLLIENYLYERPDRYSSASVFIYVLPGSLIFSILTLSWIRAVSILAALFIIIIASALMTLTIWLYHLVKTRAGALPGYISFITFWLTLELLCLKLKILSPWVNLGNGLSKDLLFIQWYEVTGTSGGTLWLLLSNLFLFLFIMDLIKGKNRIFRYLMAWILIVTIPSALSIIRYYTIKMPSGPGTEVVIIQPDIDPIGEKFTVPFDIQLKRVLKMADTSVTSSTSWLITPETTVSDPVNENNLEGDKYIGMIKEFLGKHPSLSVVTGMVTCSVPSDGSVNGEIVADEKINSPDFVRYFNSALNIDTGNHIEIYHKSKLVPGFEFVPSGKLLRSISHLLPVLGDINHSYSPQSERVCFGNTGGTQKIAPVICFESIFGEYVTDYIKKGAEAIFVLTNDGWWKNTNAFKLHLSYASLRAVETRRPVLRAANTGISCFINIRGNIIRETYWWTESTLKGTFYSGTGFTPYVILGDIILKISLIISLISLSSVFLVLPFLRRIK